MTNTFKLMAENLRNIRIAQINYMIRKAIILNHIEKNERTKYSLEDLKLLSDKIESANIREMSVEQSNEIKELSEMFFR
jgi:hypothetical protein